MTPWGAFVSEHLQQHGWSLRQVAARLGMAPSELSRAIRGLASFARKHAEPLADILELEGRERDRFLLLVELNRSPPGIQRYVLELEQRLRDRGGAQAVRRAAEAATDDGYHTDGAPGRG